MKKTITTRIILILFGSVPLKVRRGIFKAAFLFFYHLSSKHRLITLHNLKCAYPEKDMQSLGKIAKRAFLNLGIVVAEFFEIPSLTRENIHDLIEFNGFENYTKAMSKNRGVLFFTAHFGNWELLAISFALAEQPFTIIYRPLDNPLLENLVTYVRACKGNKPLPKERATKQILRRIKKKEVVGTLLDQNMAWQEGVFVDFFGRPACTADGLASLALYTEAPVVPAFMVRMENGKYRFIVEEEVEIINTGNPERDILTNTQNFTKVIEGVVRKYPDQWLWVHQRWKTKRHQVS
jgi:KDO2-lipid IV(A) lauroyltransferase